MFRPGPSATMGNQKVYSYVHQKNKLQVLLCPITGSSVTAYMRAVKAGSRDESSNTPTGAAHFIEHMSFRINNGKIWDLASKGDTINAETNMDSTRFYVVHLPEQTEETIKIDAARFRSSAVPSAKLTVERAAVLNELERGQQAGNQMFQTTSAVAILKHPYHHSTIGTKADIMATTAADMQHFRSKYYVPNNTTLIFVGKMHPEEILNMVETHFGSLSMGNDCERVGSPEPPQNGARSVELCIPAPCPMTCMAFRAPSAATKSGIVLKCISRLLFHRGEGRAKELIDDLVVHDVSTYSPRQLDPYLWFFHATQERTSEDIRTDTVSKMMSVLQSFETVKVSAAELEHVKGSMLDEWNRSTESAQDIMEEIGRSVSIGNWKDFQDKKTTLESITVQDISKVASDIFDRKNMTVTFVIPTAKRNEQKTGDDKMTTLQTSMSPAIQDLMVEQKKTDWKLQKLSPTISVIHQPRAQYVRAILSARFSPAEHDMASLLVASIRSPQKSQEFNALLMSLHAERDVTHDHEYIHLNMQLPIKGIAKAGETILKKDWLNSNFDEHLLEIHKRHLCSELMSRKNDQTYQNKKEFINTLFEKTQYNIPLTERISRITKITTTILAEFHKKFIKNSPTHVTLVAPSTGAIAELGQIFNSKGSPPLSTLEWTSLPRKDTQIRKNLPGYGSAAIMIGQTVSNKITLKEKIALKAAIEILGGGMTGRLMHVVREQKGLGTYGIYANLQNVSERTDHIFCIQGTFSPTSLDEGLSCVKELVQNWHRDGISEHELTAAKSAMVGKMKIAMDDVDQLADIMLKYILEQKNPNVAIQNFEKNVALIDTEFVNKTIKKCINPQKFAEVVIGTV